MLTSLPLRTVPLTLHASAFCLRFRLCSIDLVVLWAVLMLRSPLVIAVRSKSFALHSVRLPGFVASQQVILGGLGQTLTLRHDSTGRDSFMPGVVASVRAVMDTRGLVVGLDRLFGLA